MCFSKRDILDPRPEGASEVHEALATQNIVPGPALEMQSLRPHPRLTESDPAFLTRSQGHVQVPSRLDGPPKPPVEMDI